MHKCHLAALMAMTVLSGCQMESGTTSGPTEKLAPPYPADAPLTDKERETLLPAYKESSMATVFRNYTNESTVNYLDALNWPEMIDSEFRPRLTNLLERTLNPEYPTYTDRCPDGGYAFSDYQRSAGQYYGQFGHYSCLDYYKEWIWIGFIPKRIIVGENRKTGAYQVAGNIGPVHPDYGLPTEGTFTQSITESQILRSRLDDPDLLADLSAAGITNINELQQEIVNDDTQVETMLMIDIRSKGRSDVKGRYSFYLRDELTGSIVLKERIIPPENPDDPEAEETRIPYFEIIVYEFAVSGDTQTYDANRDYLPNGGSAEVELVRPLKMLGEVNLDNQTVTVGYPIDGTLRITGTGGYIDVSFTQTATWIGNVQVSKDIGGFGGFIAQY